MNVNPYNTMANENKFNWTLGEKQTQSFDPAQDGTKPISDYHCVFQLAVYNLVLSNGNVMHIMPNGRNFYGELTKWQMHQKQMQ